jgi:FkbM family methyltransferase
MKDMATTILESVNHLLQEHPQLAHSIRHLADIAYGNNRVDQRYFGLNGLDQKLTKWLDYDGGYFVELGANDGIDQSNSRHFEKFRNWKGVLVEPTPHNFLSCLKHRLPETLIFCNACVSFEYSDKFVEIIYSNLMSTPLGLESDIDNPLEHANLGQQFLNSTDKIFSFGAIAIPLNNLLEKAKSPKLIDLLSLDVEGGEIEVLKGIDHNTYRFKYICIENRDPLKLEKYMDSIGYKIVEKLSPHDYLFSGNRD